MRNRIINIETIADLVAEPVSVTEAKNYLHVDFSNDDTFIGMLISSARKRLEKYCAVSMGTKTIRTTMDVYCYQELPFGPVNSITSALYDGSVSTDYEISGDEFTPQTYGRWEVTYTTNGIFNEDLKLAILAEVAFRYENRGDENVATLCNMAKDLAMPYKNLSWV